INKLNLELTQKTTRLSEHVQKTLIENKNRLTDLERSIDDLSDRIETNHGLVSETRQKIEALSREISEKNTELSAIIKERGRLEKEKERLNSEIQKMALEKESVLMQKSNVSENVDRARDLLSELKASLPDDLNVPGDLLDRDKKSIEAEITKCKNEVLALGNVNMMAIEKYNESNARFEDLNKRHELLIKERESILEFMEKIEKQKKSAFLQTFQSIARNFSYIFSRLSPGGEGMLELENYDDPFAGGVLIKARPAGKPLNEISLLSGGEKSLTSLSLIFAIQQHSPSPLYVLDEIDAALDDYNASLVGDLIRELSVRSQFIIISHRDVTMAKSDRILGVSSVDGCTSVLQMDLNEISRCLQEDA
ncbi:MAG: hypothetical protein ACXQS8_08870, partial [Candidatus Helarchaeales archaeon]